jgi:hypothetical protein
MGQDIPGHREGEVDQSLDMDSIAAMLPAILEITPEACKSH